MDGLLGRLQGRPKAEKGDPGREYGWSPRPTWSHDAKRPKKGEPRKSRRRGPRGETQGGKFASIYEPELTSKDTQGESRPSEPTTPQRREPTREVTPLLVIPDYPLRENPVGDQKSPLSPRRKADTLAAQRSPRAPSQAEAQDSPPDQRTLHTFHHDDMASPSPPPTFRLVQKTEKDPRSRPLEPQKRGSSEVSPTTEKERLSERHPSAARDSAARSLDPRAHPIPLPHQDDMHVLLGRTIRVRVQQTATRQTQEVTLSPRTKHPGKLHPRAREETQEAPLDAPTKRTPGNSTSGARPPRKETGRGSGAGTPPPRQLTLRAQNGNPKSPLPSPEQEPRSHQSRRKRAQESRRERIHRPFPQRYECLLGRLQGSSKRPKIETQEVTLSPRRDTQESP
nr:serine/arginine repetitive matrix protein 1-like [Penaeus vannamei]